MGVALEEFGSAQNGDPEVLAAIVDANQGFVHRIVRQKSAHFKGMEYEDLVQEGNIGLLRAIRKFDVEKGFQFSTYAMPWIRQAIDRSMPKGQDVRMPNRKYAEIFEYKDLVKLLGKDGKSTDDAAVAEWMEWPLEKVQSIKRLAAVHSVSTSAPLGDEDDASTVGDLLESEEASVLEVLTQRSDEKALRAALERLSDRHKQLLTLRFGLADDDPHTLKEIGAIWNVSRERVRQIELKAKDALRYAMTNQERVEPMGKKAICKRCEKERSIAGRGLCASCYANHRNEYPTLRKMSKPREASIDERGAAKLALLGLGYKKTEIEERLANFSKLLTADELVKAFLKKDPPAPAPAADTIFEIEIKTDHDREIMEKVAVAAQASRRTPSDWILCLIEDALL